MSTRTPDSVAEMIEVLQSHGVPDWLYVIDTISGDEVYGITLNEKGEWTTYYCERGKKNDIQIWPSEADAVKELYSLVEEIAKYQGYWKTLPVK